MKVSKTALVIAGLADVLGTKLFVARRARVEHRRPGVRGKGVYVDPLSGSRSPVLSMPPIPRRLGAYVTPHSQRSVSPART